MCDHLLNWGLGRFISTVTSDRRYKVTATAPVGASSLAAKSFASKFYEPLNAAVDYLEAELKTLIEEELQQHQDMLKKQIDEKNLQESERRKADLNGVINNSDSLNITNSRPFSSPSYSSSGSGVQSNKGNSMFNFSHLNNPAARRSNLNTNYDTQDREIIKAVKKGSTFNLDSLKDDIIQKKYESNLTANFTSKYSKQRMDYTLPCILAVFNGFQTLDKAIRKLPLPLHQFGVDIVIWLLRFLFICYFFSFVLVPIDRDSSCIHVYFSNICNSLLTFFNVFVRWRMVEEVHIYVIALPEHYQEVPDNNQASLELNQSQNKSKNNQDESKASSSSHHHIEMPTVTESGPSLNSLNETELDMYHKIYPYLNGTLPLHEIAWREYLVEDEILRLVKKLPHITVFFS